MSACTTSFFPQGEGSKLLQGCCAYALRRARATLRPKGCGGLRTHVDSAYAPIGLWRWRGHSRVPKKVDEPFQKTRKRNALADAARAYSDSDGLFVEVAQRRRRKSRTRAGNLTQCGKTTSAQKAPSSIHSMQAEPAASRVEVATVARNHRTFSMCS